jgi:hypothetical protein
MDSETDIQSSDVGYFSEKFNAVSDIMSDSALLSPIISLNLIPFIMDVGLSAHLWR